MSNTSSKTYRPTLGGSIGAGMTSVFSPGSKRYYILEHRVTSQYHRAGETQEIIVDQIELGRDARCQVRFDERFATVSRRHAAIVREGDGWKLVQLSKNNTTLLNGRPVKDEWYLQNGDEIQLSVNGPRLGFIVPTGKKATVGSIGLTRRLSLFRQQALRPYKQAIAAMAALLVIAVGGLTAWNLIIQHDLKDNTKQLAEAVKNNKALSSQLMAQAGVIDSLSKLKPRVVERIREKTPSGNSNGNGKQGDNITPIPAQPEDLSTLYPHIYVILASAYYKEQVLMSWIGTGFQLDNGKFVTARHVTTPFYSNSFYIRDGVVVPRVNDPKQICLELMLNVLMQAGEVTVRYECRSLTDSFTFTHSQVKEEGKYDEVHTLEQPFQYGEITIPAGAPIRSGALGAVDYAYIDRSAPAGLKANTKLSTSLKQGTKLFTLGYPHGLGARGTEKPKPIYSEAVCAQDGLSEEFGGCIMVSNDNTEGGNSGGPIFVTTDKGNEVVAIVSGSTYQKGRFVPISVLGK